MPKTQTNRDPLSLAAVAIAVSCCALPVPAANENPAISRAINAERYEEALSLISAELDRNPGDAQAWFDKGRVIAVMNRGSPPDDYCDADANWIFLALGHLSEGMRRDQARVEVLIGADASAFAAFRETPEFKNWWTATRPLPELGFGVARIRPRPSGWNRGGPATLTREGLTLRPDGGVDLFAHGRTSRIGTWKVGQGQLVIAVGKTNHGLLVDTHGVRRARRDAPIPHPDARARVDDGAHPARLHVLTEAPFAATP